MPVYKHQSRSQYTKFGGPAVSEPRCPVSGEPIKPGEGLHIVVKDRKAASYGRSYLLSRSVLNYRGIPRTRRLEPNNWGFLVTSWLRDNNFSALSYPAQTGDE